MNIEDIGGWRNVIALGLGLYRLHPHSLSVRILQRRIRGLSKEDAQFLLALIAVMVEMMHILDEAQLPQGATLDDLIDLNAPEELDTPRYFLGEGRRS